MLTCKYYIIRMDLLNVPQVDCLRCQNSINLLIANDQEHGELICERCLELETKKHIHLKLEIQSYERKIKDIKDLSQQEQQRYMKNTDAIIQTHEEENLTQLEYNEMSKELNDVEEQIREEEAQSSRLYEQLLEIEKQQRRRQKEYLLQCIDYDKIHQQIAEQQFLLAHLTDRQAEIKDCSQFIEQHLKQ